ncbi:DUF1214 domain-containing protein [Halioglobus pacificus]|uniref:DUF1214 domain-containing protein n=1 Tax=Parahalioglobus pacificus TaxID=930806 RepID=A0A918XEG9_9GAMM|nr:DUF1214 domain-containing protein [Halioglobus pacificus]GHD28001.1 hypothetical protein GCM10007053_06940 [Halioglobus pacificus]
MKLLRWLIAALLTLTLAVAFLLRSVGANLGATSLQNGDWAINMSVGSADANALQRASVALGGLLGSTRENSVYYRIASVDGEPLRLNCDYRIEGGDYDANWWSITAYGWDNYLIPNPQKRYSYNNENLARDSDGSWVISVSAQEKSGDWIPIGPSGGPPWRKFTDNDFDLLLRLYTPGVAYLETPASAPVPTVTLEACR